jgi:hypothetical protein
MFADMEFPSAIEAAATPAGRLRTPLAAGHARPPASVDWTRRMHARVALSRARSRERTAAGSSPWLDKSSGVLTLLRTCPLRDAGNVGMSGGNALKKILRAGLCAAALAVSAGCAKPAVAPVRGPPSRSAEGHPNWVCGKLMGQFLGLPADNQGGDATAALVGSWWIRDCSIQLVGRSQLQLRLGGTGWYWVDSDEGGIALHQQVPFDMSAEVVGTIRTAYAGGVAWLWFEPTRVPIVEVSASTQLELGGATLWGSVLRRIPLLPLRAMMAERLSAAASAAFQARLRRGLTVSYDVFKGQTETTLGQRAPGELLPHPFEDDSSWIVNDRLLLPPGATLVFGPLEPTPLLLDVVVEQGPGLAYRAVCTRDMAGSLEEVAAGRPERLPAKALVASGTMLGSGPLASELQVDACPYYLIVSSGGPITTVVAFRLRT